MLTSADMLTSFGVINRIFVWFCFVKSALVMINTQMNMSSSGDLVLEIDIHVFYQTG